VTNDVDPAFLRSAEQSLSRIVGGRGSLRVLSDSTPSWTTRTSLRSLFGLPHRKTVAMDVSVSEERLWTEQVHSKNRNMIKKARNAGLEFFVDEAFGHMAEFKQLYAQTMRRLDADSFYYFADTPISTVWR